MEQNNIAEIKEAQLVPELQLLSVKDVCRYLNVGHWMVYKLFNEKKLESITIHKRRLVTVQALQNFIANSKDGFNG